MTAIFTCLLALLFSTNGPAKKGNVEIWHSTLAADGTWNAVDMTGDAAAQARLANQLQRNGLTSNGIPFVVPSEH